MVILPPLQEQLPPHEETLLNSISIRHCSRLRRPFLVHKCLVVLALAFLWAGCDSPPGPELTTGRPPVLSNLSHSPSHVDLADLDDEDVQDGIVVIRVDLAVDVAAVDVDVEEVRYVVRLPVRSAQSLASGRLTSTDGSEFGGQLTIAIPVGAVGDYQVVVYAVDEFARTSNQLYGMVRYRAPSEPPVIDRVILPEVVQRPAPGEAPVEVLVAADVSDPDGLANIERVVFWNVENPGAAIELFDDGGAGGSGDETAGDGRFSRTITVTNDNEPGVNTFAFQARDRAGLESEVVEAQITVE